CVVCKKPIENSSQGRWTQHRLTCEHSVHAICGTLHVSTSPPTTFHQCPKCLTTLDETIVDELWIPHKALSDLKSRLENDVKDGGGERHLLYGGNELRIEPVLGPFVRHGLSEFRVHRPSTCHQVDVAMMSDDESDWSSYFTYPSVEERRHVQTCLESVLKLIFTDPYLKDFFIVYGSVLTQTHLRDHARAPQDLDLMYLCEGDGTAIDVDEAWKWTVGKRILPDQAHCDGFYDKVYYLVKRLLTVSSGDDTVNEVDFFNVIVKKTFKDSPSPSVKLIVTAHLQTPDLTLSFSIDIMTSEVFIGPPQKHTLKPSPQSQSQPPITITTIPLPTLIAWKSHSCMEHTLAWRPKDLYDLAFLLPALGDNVTEILSPHVRLACFSRGQGVGEGIGRLVRGEMPFGGDRVFKAVEIVRRELGGVLRALEG
ncbi:hypothetical protein HDU67_002780, partial [Dinochytrium kinnereticum]